MPLITTEPKLFAAEVDSAAVAVNAEPLAGLSGRRWASRI
jgi:hypothetical protein